MYRLVFATTVSVAALLGAGATRTAPQLPAPYHTPNATNGPRVVEKPEGAELKVPNGFTVQEFASGFEKPRIMLQAPGGQILLVESVAKGKVLVLTDADKDGKADGTPSELISGLDRPYGMAWWKDYLYVAEPTSVKRYKFDAANATVGKGEEVISLPADFGKGHWTRSITFDPKGEKLYIDIGSGSNASPDTDERRATIMQCNADGSACEIYAGGLRNATTIAFHPVSKELWASVQERDGLGDDLVPDFFTHIEKGGFYGWPYSYFGANEDPRNAGLKPELVKKTLVPDVNLGAHVAVIDWKFYTGKQFPAKYRNGAFLALHGSSNRSSRVGYSVVFQPFRNGKPSGPLEQFLGGWMISPNERDVWGRPTGILQTADGSLLVSEDGSKKIYKISYKR